MSLQKELEKLTRQYAETGSPATVKAMLKHIKESCMRRAKKGMDNAVLKYGDTGKLYSLKKPALKRKIIEILELEEKVKVEVTPTHIMISW